MNEVSIYLPILSVYANIIHLYDMKWTSEMKSVTLYKLFLNFRFYLCLIWNLHSSNTYTFNNIEHGTWKWIVFWVRYNLFLQRFYKVKLSL